MSNFKYGFLALFAVLMVLAACRKDDVPLENLSTKKVEFVAIEGVNGPTAGKVDQELSFDLLWHNSDSTQRFHHISDSTISNTRIIKLYLKRTSADSLKLDTGIIPASYKFKATEAGIYYLKFYKDSTGKAAIIDTVTIK